METGLLINGKPVKARGFTIVEMMVVVTIIGVLASIVIPFYQDYSKRARMSEALLFAAPCRTAVSEIYATGSTPPSAGRWGCEISQPSRFVSDVTTDANGKVTVTLTGFNETALDGTKIDMTPYLNGTSAMTISTGLGKRVFKWICGPAASNPTPVRYLPGTCRGQL